MSTNKKSKNPKLITDWTSVPFGIVLAAVGICFIAFSSIIEYLALAVGIFVIVGATVLATVTLIGKRSGALFVLKLIFSVFTLAAGIITIVFKDNTAAIICIVLAGAVAVDGSIKLGTAIRARQYSVSGRSVAVALSVITTVSALVMVRYTPSEITDENIGTYAVIIGITFILDALTNILMPFLKKGINDRIVDDIATRVRILDGAEAENTPEPASDVASLEEAPIPEEIENAEPEAELENEDAEPALTEPVFESEEELTAAEPAENEAPKEESFAKDAPEAEEKEAPLPDTDADGEKKEQ